MTYYQNIFTRVQVRGAPDLGIPLEPGIWERKNPWFTHEVLPALKVEVRRALDAG